MNTEKSFNITKQMVWQAYQTVRANKGGEGIDQETMESFERNLKDNLYKIWNRSKRLGNPLFDKTPVRTYCLPITDAYLDLAISSLIATFIFPTNHHRSLLQPS